MNYFEEDLSFFLSTNTQLMYLLSNEKKFISHINALTQLATQYGDLIDGKSLYQYEFLDDFYSINQRLKSFNVQVCEDLTSLGLKCAQSAAYYCLMKPNKSYLPSLKKCLDIYPEHNFLFQLAYLFNSDEFSYINPEYFSKIIQLQSVFSQLHDSSLPLRKSLSHFQLEQLIQQTQSLKNFYHCHGVEKTLVEMKKMSMYPYLLNHKSWLSFIRT